ncbi:MAG: HAD-IC family P-type ATPase, partial [Desulfobulbaceae bacterium]|nr:HAD-IC family P-type ATPase [Desulfobulbaceae bacterium]
MDYYREPVETVLSSLKTSKNGLSSEEATKRITKFGHNTLETKSSVNPLLIFLNQFKSFIIYILLFAVAFSLLIGEYVDSIIILIILLANALIGFFQELSANRSLEALKKMTSIKAKVMRNGILETMDSMYLVPGDIIRMEAGDNVPADARIIESVRLKVEEASLTGESVPAEKEPIPLTEEKQISDRKNMLFSSTAAVTGNCRAVIVATGMQTEIGKITRLIKEAEEEMTPLQKRLDVFGKKLGTVIIGICIFIFLLSFGKEYLASGITAESFIAFAFIAISLAVAAVPTALPAVVTIALSIGVKRLLKKKALVRRLSSVETLGSCDVICTD